MQSEYIWNLEYKLSPNAVDLLRDILERYQPEPWDAGLREQLLQMFTRATY